MEWSVVDGHREEEGVFADALHGLDEKIFQRQVPALCVGFASLSQI